MLQLTNPLTDAERKQVVRLIDHDMGNSLNIVNQYIHHIVEYGKKELSPIAQGKVKATFFIGLAIHDLVLKDKLDVWKCYYNIELEDILNSIDCQRVKFNFNYNPKELVTPEKVLLATMWSIIKNAHNASETAENVLVTSRYYEGFPKQALYIPDGAREFKDFVAFEVHNQGEFPKAKPLREYIDKEAPALNQEGFGLYFVKLASKVLRAPVNIKSEDGRTCVSFYHPIYPEK